MTDNNIGMSTSWLVEEKKGVLDMSAEHRKLV